ncbi:glycosyltransferase [Prosthecobacter sp.]|uniref:glycosyltransferase n=1 Tax=Prosthecobacter sp. TaxID=1965333 RepID=UPI00378361C4
MPKTVVVTDFTSPYQIELFNAVEELAPGQLNVIYLHQRSAGREWSLRKTLHRSVMLERDVDGMTKARALVDAAELAVFNFYDDRHALELIRRRAALDTAWCFWGERPGFYHMQLGRLRRLWMLAPLHARRAAIWGIGTMAVNAYREEFGAFRDYVNLPYYSDLSRFQALPVSPPRAGGVFTFLYSGALIRRKGVDLVARAFRRLAAAHPQARLRIMGSGPLEKKLRRILRFCMAQVEFTGFKDWAALPDEYASANVICVPSRYDGWGLVVPEGLAAGLPVISTEQTGAAVDFLRPGKNGWLIQANDEEAVHQAMREAVSLEPARWAEMSAAARATVAGHGLDKGAAGFIRAAVSAASGW